MEITACGGRNAHLGTVLAKKNLMNHLTILILGVMAITLGMAPQAEGVLARFINIKKGAGDTRFHLGELEAFEAGVVPDEAGAVGRGGATSRNDIAGVTTFILRMAPR